MSEEVTDPAGCRLADFWANNMYKAESNTVRGPACHPRREQILAIAGLYFERYGYGKTTVSDLANAIGLSKAYIYKFFVSKQSMGEAICRRSFDRTLSEVRLMTSGEGSADQKLRRLFEILARRSALLYFNGSYLHELEVLCFKENWCAAQDYHVLVLELVKDIIRAGKKEKRFGQHTTEAETSLAVMQILEQFQASSLLQRRQKTLDDDLDRMVSLILRSIA